jgi:hypothetical protein
MTTKYRVTRSNYKPGVSSSYSTNDTQSIQFFLIENALEGITIMSYCVCLFLFLYMFAHSDVQHFVYQKPLRSSSISVFQLNKTGNIRATRTPPKKPVVNAAAGEG